MLTVDSYLKDPGRELRSRGGAGALSRQHPALTQVGLALCPRLTLALPTEPSRKGRVGQRYSACDGDGARPREAETSWGMAGSWSHAQDMQFPLRAPRVEPPASGSRALHPTHPITAGPVHSSPNAPAHHHSQRGLSILSPDGGPTAPPPASARASTFPCQAQQNPKIHVPLLGSHKGWWSRLVTQTPCPSTQDTF